MEGLTAGTRLMVENQGGWRFPRYRYKMKVGMGLETKMKRMKDFGLHVQIEPVRDLMMELLKVLIIEDILMGLMISMSLLVIFLNK